MKALRFTPLHANSYLNLRNQEVKGNPRQTDENREACAQGTLLIAPLRYHPKVQWSFRVALKLVPPPPELSIRLLGAWKNALPSLSGVLQRRNLCLAKHDISEV